MKKLVSVEALMLVVIMGVIMVACKNNNDKIPDPCGEFEYTRVIVLLTDEVASIDKVWAPSDFPGFAFSEIFDCRGVGGAEHLFFYLAEPSRDNILRAIYYLNTRSEIKSADVIELGVDFPL